MVRSNVPSQGLQVGDHVRVPWGLDTLEGVIEDVYETGAGRRVVVRALAPDIGEPETVSLPAETVELADEAEDSPLGAWVTGARYERSVAEALQRLLPALLGEGDFQALVEPRIDPNRRPDFLIQAGPWWLVVEAKAGGSEQNVTAEAVRQLQSYLVNLPRRANLPRRHVAGLLVTDAKLTPSAQKLMHASPQLHAVRWRSARDDSRLAAAVASLLRGNNMQEQY
jgi:hypothetical protein